MKKVLVLSLSMALVFGIANGASALFFDLGYFDVDLRGVDPGLVLDWAPILTSDGFNLDLGVPLTVDLFSIWTDETDVGSGEDTESYPINVEFYFTDPPLEGDIVGETKGVRGLIQQWGEVVWDGPTTLNFESSGDNALLITLSNEMFNKGLFGLNEGERWGATVQATFEYSTGTSAIPAPEPSTMLLMGTGLLGLVAYGRKRYKRKKTSQA